MTIMKVQQNRNATLVVTYAWKKFLIDPMLSDKGTLPSFPNPLSGNANPLEELPVPVQELVSDLDAVFLSHLHMDHYDEAAKKLSPKDIRVFVQNESDKQELDMTGFKDVEILTETSTFHRHKNAALSNS